MMAGQVWAETNRGIKRRGGRVQIERGTNWTKELDTGRYKQLPTISKYSHTDVKNH